MKKYLVWLLPILFTIHACGPKENNDLTSKKQELEKLRAEVLPLQQKIQALESEIAKLSPPSEQPLVPVKVRELTKSTFISTIELQGVVSSKKNIALAAEQGGTITSVPVTEGQRVSKGQLLVQLDADAMQRSMAELETAFELAKTTFERQSNLWSQQIGSEMQYLQAKSNKESMERRMETLRSQIAKSRITAPFDGQVDMINARVGEITAPGMPLVRVVNLNDLEVVADVSEKFIGRFKVGDEIAIYFPSLNQTVKQKIKSVGNVINPNNRTFSLIANLSGSIDAFKPNLLAIIKANDRVVPNAVVVPTKLLQNEGDSTYLFIAQKQNNGIIAKKVGVKTGAGNGAETVINEGLLGNESIIIEGARNVANGDILKIISQ